MMADVVHLGSCVTVGVMSVISTLEVRAVWAMAELRGEPVRISSMVLFVAYAFYYRNVFSIIIYHHMPRERRCLRHPGPQQ